MAEQNEKNDAVSFVTKKVLVTFPQQIAIMFGGSCIYTLCAVCEFQEAEGGKRGYSGYDTPRSFTIVGLPDGRKLEKSLQLHLGLHGVTAMVELDQ